MDFDLEDLTELEQSYVDRNSKRISRTLTFASTPAQLSRQGL